MNHVPVHADVPNIELLWLDEPDPLAPMGAKGVGELGITGGAISIGETHNAIAWSMVASLSNDMIPSGLLRAVNV